MKNKPLKNVLTVSLPEKGTKQKMKIAVIGAGRVGLPVAVGLATLGHRVMCCERDSEKRRLAGKGFPPFADEGMHCKLVAVVRSGALRFCADIADAVKDVDAAIAAVPVHEQEGGQDELHKIAAVVPSDCVLIIKSTVPPGTCEQLSKLYKLHVASNPEFLRQGLGFRDFMSPSRIVAGSDDSYTREILHAIYAPLIEQGRKQNRDIKYIETDCKSAELSKLATNTYLSFRIAVTNEIADLCTEVGCNINDVMRAVGADTRIGDSCLRASAGFGGACLPKDGRLLIAAAERLGVSMPAVTAIYDSNHQRMGHIARNITNALPNRPVIAIWGAAFKPNADSICESPAINIMRNLCMQGCFLRVYEPAVDMQTMQQRVPEAKFFTTAMDALADADALVVLNGNDDFSRYSLAEIVRVMHGNVVFDYVGIFDREAAQKAGAVLYTVGMPEELQCDIESLIRAGD